MLTKKIIHVLKASKLNSQSQSHHGLLMKFTKRPDLLTLMIMDWSLM